MIARTERSFDIPEVSRPLVRASGDKSGTASPHDVIAEIDDY